MRLEGRRIVISGAASGVGRAIAKLFHQQNAAVALVDRDADRLATTCAELAAGGGAKVASAVADVTDDQVLRASIDQVAHELGGLDGLVGVAGLDLERPFDQMSRADWDQVLTVNLTGAFSLTSASLPHLKQAGGGSVLLVASGAALRPIASRTAYCASKAGVVMFAKALAVDLAEAGIRSNVICPGVVDTPMFRSALADAPDPKEALASVLDRYLIKEIARPDDIANAALFLTSDEAAHITGAALAVDGGRAFH